MPQLVTAFLGVAHIHTPDFIARLNKRADEVSVKAVFDRDAARGQKRAADLPGAAFTSEFQSILADPEISAVVVCAETLFHRELVTAAARAGKHIFCEKPLGLGKADADAMAEAIKAAGVTFQTGFASRSTPVAQFVKREVNTGHLGRITRAHYYGGHSAALGGWFDTDWRWLADPKLAGGGAMLDLGAHPLDLIVDTYWPTQGDVVDVAATLGSGVARYGDIDEWGTALLTFASGAAITLDASWVDPKFGSPLEVFGTDGQIQVIDGQARYFSKHVAGADGSPATDLPPAAPHAFELFWDKLLGKELAVPLVTVEQAATGSALMERIYQAAGRSTTTGLRP